MKNINDLKKWLTECVAVYEGSDKHTASYGALKTYQMVLLEINENDYEWNNNTLIPKPPPARLMREGKQTNIEVNNE